MRDVYLDNSATTPVLPGVADIMRDVLTTYYGNPSSLHRMGISAERIQTQSRRVVAEACGVRESEIFFTSGGTEANNLAIKGVARRLTRRGMHLITTKVEHPSVLYAFRALEAEGFSVTYLDVDKQGLVTPEAVASAMQKSTILVSIMHVNNEVGTVMPVENIGPLVKKLSPDALFHVDAVQSFGKLPVRPSHWLADLVSLSAHKIHGPKGAGALYRREGIPVEPLLHGGDQENGLRPGTENTAGIAGFGEAAKQAMQHRETNYRYMAALKQRLLEGMLHSIPDIVQNGPTDGAAHILNVTIAGVKGEVLVHALEDAGIFISTGSACHSHRADPSHVLLAMGRTERDIEASLRFSFSAQVTQDDISYTLEKLQDAVASLRLVTRRRT